MDVDPLGRPLGRHSAPPLANSPAFLLLLGVHRDHRLPGVQALARRGHVAELGVPVRVLGALGDLGVPLQAVTFGLQQPRHRRGRAPVPAAVSVPARFRVDRHVQRAASSPYGVSP